MNSRERIIASINHKQVDIVPIDLGSTTSSGISAIAYNNLKQYLGINKGYTRVYDIVQQLAQPEDEILDMFNVDVLDVGRVYNTEEKDWYDITLPSGHIVQFPTWFKPIRDEEGNLNVYSEDGILISRMKKDAFYFHQEYYPYLNGYPENYDNITEAMNKVQWFKIAVSPWDHLNDTNFWEDLREKALNLRENSDRALVISSGCSLLESGNYLRRMDNFLMDIYTCPEEVERLLDVLVEQHLALLEKVCKAVGDVVDIIRFSDDLGMDQGPLMSPEVFRKIFKPRLALLCDYVKKHSNMHTFLHSCGSIYKLLPDLIEAGIEIINPVQTTAKDMEPYRLKKEFGNDITFWGGGCNTRSILNRATPKEVKDYVKRQLEVFAPGGGYIFNQEHNILPDVPPENIIAMFEAVREFSF
ncbi:uroporphyrinogen decarboxylase family protein [Neomoorella humiferrea]|uniref:Methylcobalamin:coenzyme M methyltransferase n=1 Tax=Neomoorella humiferrea TaxID=676965 RepID=A0A2T0AMC2_9FIRM|nr:uroporphyrinogen decarboxylase family protein [Moorella humiferrea]PRR69897.1 methylcobalamin:coenzyme M methyltransferase [Moorella humiferrea]